jgi:dGTPase
MARGLYNKADQARLVTVVNPADAKERYRTCWRRDYARLIHSAAFRRLQGKTQLYPGAQSDFFRNRLTHSLEVAQIAKSIAIMINDKNSYFRNHNIDTDLVETAALAHDLGHPPFGHNGEAALNDCMRCSGGFEGNAQTLRILSRLEKRQTIVKDDPDIQKAVHNGKDNRAGLNLTYRTLASILKYDREIPINLTSPTAETAEVMKGYYRSEAPIVDQIKKHVGVIHGSPFKTIECSIMDVADDIAYSTYDVEDSFKAGFLTPISMWVAPESVKEGVAQRVKERLDRFYPHASPQSRKFEVEDVYLYLFSIFRAVFDDVRDLRLPRRKNARSLPVEFGAVIAHLINRSSDKLVTSGYYRTRFTSDLVGTFIRSVRVTLNKQSPALSRVALDIEAFKQVEVLKNFAFQSLIMSPRLKVAEHRGKDIVKQIFNALESDQGYLLMPESLSGNIILDCIAFAA